MIPRRPRWGRKDRNMYIAVPHQLPPHLGHDCIMGDWNCEADCPGCRDRRDSHLCIGDPDTSPAELRRLALEYHGHQAGKVHDLAEKLG